MLWTWTCPSVCSLTTVNGKCGNPLQAAPVSPDRFTQTRPPWKSGTIFVIRCNASRHASAGHFLKFPDNNFSKRRHRQRIEYAVAYWVIKRNHQTYPWRIYSTAWYEGRNRIITSPSPVAAAPPTSWSAYAPAPEICRDTGSYVFKFQYISVWSVERNVCSKPGIGESPTRPGILCDIPFVEVPADTMRCLSITTIPIVSWFQRDTCDLSAFEIDWAPICPDALAQRSRTGCFVRGLYGPHETFGSGWTFNQ